MLLFYAKASEIGYDDVTSGNDRTIRFMTTHLNDSLLNETLDEFFYFFFNDGLHYKIPEEIFLLCGEYFLCWMEILKRTASMLQSPAEFDT